MRNISAKGGYAGWHGNAKLQAQGSRLRDDLCLLPNQLVSHTVKRLGIDLVQPLYTDKSHCWSLNCFGNSCRIVGVVFWRFK
ncbi:MAG: hypothetical protein U5K76_12485 [Woeseiaceae bacterium]|nr:hypothetical protein [Woeseiaceae bacterium]